MTGNQYVPPPKTWAEMTSAERGVVIANLLSAGLDRQVIAVLLGITVRSVSQHIRQHLLRLNHSAGLIQKAEASVSERKIERWVDTASDELPIWAFPMRWLSNRTHNSANGAQVVLSDGRTVTMRTLKHLVLWARDGAPHFRGLGRKGKTELLTWLPSVRPELKELCESLIPPDPEAVREAREREELARLLAKYPERAP